VTAHGIGDRNDYVLALVEADLALELTPVFASEILRRYDGPGPRTLPARRRRSFLLGLASRICAKR